MDHLLPGLSILCKPGNNACCSSVANKDTHFKHVLKSLESVYKRGKMPLFWMLSTTSSASSASYPVSKVSALPICDNTMHDHDPIGDLGLACPLGGNFYICTDRPTRFIGCCTSNPCTSGRGECAYERLRPAIFNGGLYDAIPDQTCVSDNSDVGWYACSGVGDSFMGCCAEDACEKGCKRGMLRAARLSDSRENAKVFLDGLGAATLTKSVSGTTSSGSVAITAGATSTSSADDGVDMNAGGIVGLCFGLMLLAFVVGFTVGWILRKVYHRRSKLIVEREERKHHRFPTWSQTQSGWVESQAPRSHPAPAEPQAPYRNPPGAGINLDPFELERTPVYHPTGVTAMDMQYVGVQEQQPQETVHQNHEQYYPEVYPRNEGWRHTARTLLERWGSRNLPREQHVDDLEYPAAVHVQGETCSHAGTPYSAFTVSQLSLETRRNAMMNENVHVPTQRRSSVSRIAGAVR